MTEIAIKIVNQVIQLAADAPRLVAGSAGVYAVTLAYDAQWDDATVRVVVFDGGLCNSRVSVQDTTGTVTIPAECIAHGGRGNWLQIGVLGYDGTGALRITTRAMLDGLRIDPAGVSDADVPQDPPTATPGLWEQLVADVGNLSDLQTADTSSLVAAINELVSSSGQSANIQLDRTLRAEDAAADSAAVGAIFASMPDMLSGGETVTVCVDPGGSVDGINYNKASDDTPAFWELIGGIVVPIANVGGSPPGYTQEITSGMYVKLSDRAYGLKGISYMNDYCGVVVATAATSIPMEYDHTDKTIDIPSPGIYLGTYRYHNSTYSHVHELTYKKDQKLGYTGSGTTDHPVFVVPVTQDEDGNLSTTVTAAELQAAIDAGKACMVHMPVLEGDTYTLRLVTARDSIYYFAEAMVFDEAELGLYVTLTQQPDGGLSVDVLMCGNSLVTQDNALDVIPPMQPASADEDGLQGLVPAPAAGDEGKFLRGDGTWQGAGGAELFWITISVDDAGTWSSDKTYAETLAAIEANLVPVCRIPTTNQYGYQRPVCQYVEGYRTPYEDYIELYGLSSSFQYYVRIHSTDAVTVEELGNIFQPQTENQPASRGFVPAPYASSGTEYLGSDANWHSLDLEKAWTLIGSVTLNATVLRARFTKNAEDTAFYYKELMVRIPNPQLGNSGYFSCACSQNDSYFNAIRANLPAGKETQLFYGVVNRKFAFLSAWCEGGEVIVKNAEGGGSQDLESYHEVTITAGLGHEVDTQIILYGR